MTQETKDKISKTLKLKFKLGLIHPNMSGAHSNKSRIKQSKSKKGKKLSNKHKNSISQGINNSKLYFEAIHNPKRIKKIKKTNLIRYGVENVFQVKEIFEKQQKNACYSRKFKKTNINYRGSYELDFLNKYYDIYSDLKNGLSIKYKFKEKNKIYFPDFYIPSLNLIVEIKNSYLAKKDAKILESKKLACKNFGYNFIMIIDKNYSEFNLL